MKRIIMRFRPVTVLMLVMLLAGCPFADAATESAASRSGEAACGTDSGSGLRVMHLDAQPAAAAQVSRFAAADTASPSAPASVNAVAVSRTGVKISWSAAADADAYFLKRYNSGTGEWDIIAQTTGLEYNDTGLTANTAYRYHVVAYRIEDGLVRFAQPSAEACAVTPQYAYAPDSVSAVPAGRTNITVSWSAAAGADAYFVKRYNAATGEWDIFAQTAGLCTTDTNLIPGTSYRYHVVAYAVIDGIVRFAPVSAEAQAATPQYACAPASVNAYADSPVSVTVSWSAAAGADAYFLKRYNTVTGEWDIIAQTTGYSFTDSNRSPGTDYRYHVVAYAVIDGTVRFAPVSAEASVTTPLYVYAPSEVTASAVSAYAVKIEWNASAGAEGYALKRYNASTGEWDILLQTTLLSYTDMGCAPQSEYRYHVVAYCMADGSVRYAPVSREVTAATPSFGQSPASLEAEAGASRVKLSWQAAPGAQAYAIKRYNEVSGGWDVIAQTAATDYTDKGREALTTYRYTVVPYATSGSQTHYAAAAETSASTPAVSAPESVTAYAAGRNEITLHWDQGDRAEGYVLRRSTSADGGFENVVTTADRVYTDTGLTTGQTYYYEVMAYRYINGEQVLAPALCMAQAAPQGETAAYTAAGYNNDRVVGLDSRGRAFGAINGYKDNRAVGVMYWPWFGTGAPFFDDIYDISVILSQPDGFNKLFYQDTPDSPAGGTHYWGEPLWGYYHSRDPYVLRRQLELLTNAGVDFLFLDTTNAWIYTEAVTDLMRLIDEMQREGWNPPKIVYYTHSHSLDTIRSIYNEVYSRNLYPGTWYRINGKPVIIGYTNVSDDLAEAAVRGDTEYNPAPLSQEILSFFTFRMPQWPDEAYRSDGFPWIEFSYPQPMHGNVMNVSAASNTMPPFSFSLTRGLNNWGRGYNTATGANSYADVFNGRFFQSSWDTVLNSSVQPETVTVNGWNQWVAGKNWYDSEYSFCDVVNMEFSSDIEMMKGGYEDIYYQMLVKNIRAYKGLDAGATGYITKSIDINGSVSQWDSVNAVFRDMGVTNYGRNYINAAGTGVYVQQAPRNNIQEIRVTKDSSYIYFYIRCSQDITEPSDARWMNIFIGRGTPSCKGWNGYEYVVNRMVNGSAASVEALSSNYLGTVTGQADIRCEGCVLQVRIPRSALGLGQQDNAFYFKVADDVTNPSEIMNYYTVGSSLPLGRLSFQYND
ncbi:MAG: hypothetical protein PUC05_00795 [Firmicutes bacterium]|nr:hypothetical protein [Bacillota bacterium]